MCHPHPTSNTARARCFLRDPGRIAAKLHHSKRFTTKDTKVHKGSTTKTFPADPSTRLVIPKTAGPSLKRCLRPSANSGGTCFAHLRVLARGALCLLCLLPATGFAKTKAHHNVVDQNYVTALATAHRFLHAWQSHDEETAVLLLTDTAKKHASDDQFATFLEAGAPATYEISRGKKLKNGRYAFPVALYRASSRESPRRPRARYTSLLVCDTGKDGWAVDKLP